MNVGDDFPDIKIAQPMVRMTGSGFVAHLSLLALLVHCIVPFQLVSIPYFHLGCLLSVLPRDRLPCFMLSS